MINAFQRSFLRPLIVLAFLLGTACSANATPVETATPTVLIITATLPPTLTPRPSPTLEPPTATPPVDPVQGQTTSQLNVRSGPSAASESLGLLPIFAVVQIVGVNPDGEWWLILYPEGPAGLGWITTEFVQVSGDPDVPVIAEPSQPSATAGPATGTVIESVNVRGAPKSDSQVLGTVAAGESVILTGVDETGTWLRIAYPAAESGNGWVNAAFLEAQGIGSLPIITETGQSLGTPTGAAVLPVATVPLSTALPDGDSLQAPAVSIVLSSAQVRSFNYSSDVSFPEGDPDDWVQFTLAGQTGAPRTVSVVLDCTGNSPLRLELVQNEVSLGSWEDLTCEERSQLILSLFAGAPYYLRMSPAGGENMINFVSYTIIVSLR